jgi:hypothetical protein
MNTKPNLTRIRLLAMTAEEAQAFIQFQVQNADVSHILWFAENHWIPSRPIEELYIEELKRVLSWSGHSTLGTKEVLQARLRAVNGGTVSQPAPVESPPVPDTETPRLLISSDPDANRKSWGPPQTLRATPHEMTQRGGPKPKEVFSFGAPLPRPIEPIKNTPEVEVERRDESPVRRAREELRRHKKIEDDINDTRDY